MGFGLRVYGASCHGVGSVSVASEQPLLFEFCGFCSFFVRGCNLSVGSRIFRSYCQRFRASGLAAPSCYCLDVVGASADDEDVGGGGASNLYALSRIPYPKPRTLLKGSWGLVTRVILRSLYLYF